MLHMHCISHSYIISMQLAIQLYIAIIVIPTLFADGEICSYVYSYIVTCSQIRGNLIWIDSITSHVQVVTRYEVNMLGNNTMLKEPRIVLVKIRNTIALSIAIKFYLQISLILYVNSLKLQLPSQTYKTCTDSFVLLQVKPMINLSC